MTSSATSSTQKASLAKPLDRAIRVADAPHQRYLALDALRGVAALAVVVFHIPQLFGLPHQDSSSLAVDLFFILSGFVVEHAYGDHLRHDMTFSRFIAVRMIRLYPLYIIGVAAYALFFLARPNVTAVSLAPGVLLAFLYLPVPQSISFDPMFLFPVNPVSWSLFCELFVNILYALFMVRMNPRPLFLTTIVFGAVLLIEKLYLPDAIDRFGPWSVLLNGIPRALFSFFAGVLANRLSPHRSHAGSSIVILMLIVIFSLNFGRPFQPVYEILVILLAFPTLLLFASSTKASGLQSKVYTLLGAISYPIYVIHMPVVLWVSAIFSHVFGRGLATIAPWSGLALVGLIAMLSYLLDRIYDQPVRRWLRHRFIRSMKSISMKQMM